MKNDKAGETKRHVIAVFGAAAAHVLIFLLIAFAPGKKMESETEKSLGPVYIVFDEERREEEIPPPPPPEEKPPVPEMEIPAEEVQEPEPAENEITITNEDAPEDAAAEPPGPDEKIAVEQSTEVDSGTDLASHIPNTAAVSAAPSTPDASASIASRAPFQAEPPPYTPPKPLSPPEAVYPASSKRRGEEGTVRILIYVNETGKAVETEIETSSGYPVLDKAALNTAKTIRFSPATRGGRPISAEVVVPIRFSLSQ